MGHPVLCDWGYPGELTEISRYCYLHNTNRMQNACTLSSFICSICQDVVDEFLCNLSMLDFKYNPNLGVLHHFRFFVSTDISEPYWCHFVVLVTLYENENCGDFKWLRMGSLNIWICCIHRWWLNALSWFLEQVYSQPSYIVEDLSLIHIWRCRRIERCRSRWSPYH